MSKGWMDKILDNIFDDEWVGKRGEKLTERELKFVQLFGRKGKTLKNIYLPKENGETSEVDVVFITQKGIFVFESKNFSGWIFGDEKNRNWTASLPNGQKNQFYNPVMQNKTHMKWMRNFIGEDVPLFSIIVFSERCELKKVTIYSEDVKVIKRDYTYATVRAIWEKNPDTLSDERINELYEKLKTLTNVDASVKAAHIENIENKYKNEGVREGNTDYIDVAKSKPALEDNVSSDADINTSESMICPKCGSKLVLRTAKKGNNVGNQFYGCSSYPKCRFIKTI